MLPAIWSTLTWNAVSTREEETAALRPKVWGFPGTEQSTTWRTFWNGCTTPITMLVNIWRWSTMCVMIALWTPPVSSPDLDQRKVV
jgi:hypothetical protein